MFPLRMCVFITTLVLAASLCNTHGLHHAHGADHTHGPDHTHGTDRTHGTDHTHEPNPTPAPDHTHAPIFPGRCPDFPATASLDINKITGQWFGVYSIKKGYDDNHGHAIKCLTETISARVDGSIVSEFSINRDGNVIEKKFIGNPTAGNSARFDLVKAEPRFEHGKENTLIILGTDNTSYLISILCASDGANHGYVVQVFSRSPALSAAGLANVNALLQQLNINDPLEPIEQSC